MEPVNIIASTTHSNTKKTHPPADPQDQDVQKTVDNTERDIMIVSSKSPTLNRKWLLLLKFEQESDVGMTCNQYKGYFFVDSVTENGAAERAGIRKGDMLCQYDLDVLEKKCKPKWNENTLNILNDLNTKTVFRIQILNPKALSKTAKARQIYTKRKLSDKRTRTRHIQLHPDVPMKPDFSLDDAIYNWDKSTYVLKKKSRSVTIIDLSNCNQVATSKAGDITLRLRQTTEAQYREFLLDRHWHQTLTSGWLTGEMIRLFTYEASRLVSSQDLFVYETLFFQQVMVPMKTNVWKNCARVMCFPICECSHWFLIAVTCTTTNASIFVMDSKKMKSTAFVTETMTTFFQACGLTTTVTKLNVKQQTNDSDCGVHVISNVLDLVALVANMLPQDDINSKILSQQKRNDVISRADLITVLDDILRFATRTTIFWGKFIDVHSHKIRAWPCRYIPVAFAFRLSRKPRGKVAPVVWIKPADASFIDWLKESDIIALDKHKVEDEEIDDVSLQDALTTAYSEAVGQAQLV